MLQFKSFLKESLLNEEEMLLEAAESQSVEADDKGKLHELLLAKYLHPATQLPEHHRSLSDNPDHAGTPEQVHEKLKNKISPAAYSEIDSHAKQSAEQFKTHLKEQGHFGDGGSIGNVHWTSNADKPNVAGDHEKTTGVKDVNSNADLIVTLHDKMGKVMGHHGISAKYGSQEPNYRNDGLASLESKSGLESGALSGMLDHHHKAMENLGYTGSADQRNIQTKIDEMPMEERRNKLSEFQGQIAGGKKLSGKNKTMHEHLHKFTESHDALPEKERDGFLHNAKNRAAMARESSKQIRTSMTQKFGEGLSKKNPDELANIIRQNVSPQTHIPHTVVHSQVKNDGSAHSHVKPMHTLTDEHLSQFEPGSLQIVPGKGTAVTIKGKHAQTGKMKVAARYTLKGSSGPHKGVVGTFKLQ